MNQVETTGQGSSAERRHLTIMMVDMVGATQRSRNSDPESFFEFIVDYQNHVKSCARKYGGYVSRYEGDGVLVYFGWPTAREDDATRAISAGLEMISGIGSLTDPAGEPASCRIGIASGTIVVGAINMGDGSQQIEVFGDTPNLTDRLQSLAQTNEIVTSSGTCTLANKQFEFAAITGKQVRDFEGDEKPYRVVRERDMVPNSQSSEWWDLQPIFGRDAQMEQITEQWEKLPAQGGRMIWINGDSGIGKTHLAQQTMARLQDEAITMFPYFCSRAHQQTPFFPFRRSIELWAEIKPSDEIDVRLAKIAGAAGLDLEAQTTRDLAPIVGGTLETANPLLRDADEEQIRIFEAVFILLRAFCDGKPSVAFVEDIHWADASSLALLEYFAKRIDELPLLVVITYRDEIDAPIPDGDNQVVIHLEALGAKDAKAMIAAVGGGADIGKRLVGVILERTEGVPLYVDAYTRAFLEAQETEATSSRFGKVIDVPQSLNDLLMERLDRLGAAKQVAQICAAINQNFTLAMLEELCELETEALEETIDQLLAANILVELHSSSERVFSFRHMLIQDAAYQGLLKRNRKQLHFEIAQTIENKFPARASADPAFVGEHYRVAERFEDAVKWLIVAASRNIKSSANREAIEQLDQAMVLNRKSESSEARDEGELRLQLMKAWASRACFGFADDNTTNAYKRVMDLAGKAGNSEFYANAVSGMFTAINSEARFNEAMALAEQLEAAAPPGSPSSVNSQLMCAISLLWQGKLEESISRLMEAVRRQLAIHNQKLNDIVLGKLSSEQLALLPPPLKAMIAIALAFRGDSQHARRFGKDALAHSIRLGNSLDVANCYVSLCNALRILRDDELSEVAQAFEDFVVDKELPYFSAALGGFKGLAMFDAGDELPGLKLLQKGWQDFTHTKARMNQVFYKAEMAECGLKTGDIDGAAQALNDGFSFCETYGERNFEAELFRIQARLRWIQDASDNAAICEMHQKAIDVADAQGAETFKWRASNQYAEFLIESENLQKARQILERGLPKCCTGANQNDAQCGDKHAKDVAQGIALFDQLRM